ncbi:MAG TPA: hypothetical protein VHM26_07465 [Chitinophagaceae bacterium]|jgi:hypothetical protein|nr:hypothetical protein [Chitinophagaceae bacterium]
MNKLQCAIIVLAICIASCSSESSLNNFAVQKDLNKTILQSTAAIKSQSEWAYASLQNQKIEPTIVERLNIWNTNATRVKELSAVIINHIHELQQKLISKAGFDPFADINERPAPARDVVRKVFMELKEGQLLHEKLALYKHELLNISQSIRDTFANKLFITGTEQVGAEGAFSNRYFNSTLADALSMLNKFENEVVIAENQVARFCNQQVYSPNWQIFFDSYAIVATPARQQVKPGEQMEIQASISIFTNMAKPVFEFAGEKVPFGEQGTSIYQFKAPSKPGVYTVPVRGTYISQRGDVQTLEAEVKYTVVSPQ